MTVALIFVPLAAAVLVGMLPLERRATEGLALLAAMVELALGLVALIRFDIHAGRPVRSDRIITHHLAGIADVHFSVGMDGLSLFMVLLTAVGIMSAISAAMWAGRAQPALLLRAAAGARGGAGAALHRAGPGAVLRRLGGHDHPALHPDGCLGRARPEGSDASSSSSLR